jgi:uncharacterized protein (TIGR03437 family)
LLLPPAYSDTSIVSAAGGPPGRIAANSIVTIYGQNLASVTWAISPQDLMGATLPLTPPGQTVHVQVNNLRLPLFYVSPTQINFFLPASLSNSASITLLVYRDIVFGPTVRLPLRPQAPEIFQAPNGLAAATHADGRPLAESSPARAGDFIVVYGTGWGPLDASDTPSATFPVPRFPVELRRRRDFQVRIDGQLLPAEDIYYAGVTPGFLGLYQANIRVPNTDKPRASLEIAIGEDRTTTTIWIPVEVSATSPLSSALHQ